MVVSAPTLAEQLADSRATTERMIALLDEQRAAFAVEREQLLERLRASEAERARLTALLTHLSPQEGRP